MSDSAEVPDPLSTQYLEGIGIQSESYAGIGIQSECISGFTCNNCLLGFTENEGPDSKCPHQKTPICNRCYSTTRKLREKFGTWPIQEFLVLPEEDRADFWRSTRGHDGRSRGGESLLDCIIHTISAARVRRTIQKFESTYHPLEVWAKKGYDADNIRKFCQDTKNDLKLGTLYCLTIESVDQETIREETATRIHKLVSLPRTSFAWERDEGVDKLSSIFKRTGRKKTKRINTKTHNKVKNRHKH